MYVPVVRFKAPLISNMVECTTYHDITLLSSICVCVYVCVYICVYIISPPPYPPKDNPHAFVWYSMYVVYVVSVISDPPPAPLILTGFLISESQKNAG